MTSDIAPKRRKRTATEAREEALAAARHLLLTAGPSAVTLAAVGKVIGMSHTNVIHHFGSASGLQSALMGRLVADLKLTLTEAVARIGVDAATPARLTDTVFDAFDEGGAGRLAAWIMLSHKDVDLEPVRAALNDLIAAIEQAAPYQDVGGTGRIGKAVMLVTLSAFGDALIGQPLREMLDEGEEAPRELVSKALAAILV
ncbi:TetR family transcriptional regulator [Parasphingorhabdus cellanae]|uniref:TetR family transcriptional regulator n=1 Tax=Parasphingorhabdus cellanae TaxID=2806553 RepID=A0ABX7T7B1_9SPHN|nr:TetR family transcriptional regulator [Parasphingorhabdus cellanae]QTD57486.1 TetR family transcriptional regulator [Parasphingorhabdus cellanae]